MQSENGFAKCIWGCYVQTHLKIRFQRRNGANRHKDWTSRTLADKRTQKPRRGGPNQPASGKAKSGRSGKSRDANTRPERSRREKPEDNDARAAFQPGKRPRSERKGNDRPAPERRAARLTLDLGDLQLRDSVGMWGQWVWGLLFGPILLAVLLLALSATWYREGR